MSSARYAPAVETRPVKLRLAFLGRLLALVAVTAAAQSTEPDAPPTAGPTARSSTEPATPPSMEPATAPAAAPTPAPRGRLPEAKRSDRAGKYGKPVTPDPDLLDGSSYEKEKRPLHGMLSEIEIGEEEGGKSDKISPDSGPAGPAGAKPPEDQKQAAKSGGGAPPPPTAAAATPPPENAAGGPQSAAADASAAAGGAGGSQSAVPQGPAGSASGAQADNLKVPEGASGGGPPDGSKPQAQKIGDASLQIQTLPQNANNVVGAQQASGSQQYDHKVPSGGSTAPSSGNAGVEKGRVVPKGL